MLKYVEAQVVFSEIPDEITLCINISNCPCHCIGCHSPYLAEDIGEYLTFDTLLKLCYLNDGITCIAFMGGDSEPSYLNSMAKVLRESDLNIKIAWYSGRQEFSKDIDLKNFDYIKLGPYIEELGPLTKNTTNQKFYKVINNKLIDNTYLFWK